MKDISDYGLDLHSSMILEEYRDCLPVFRKLEEFVRNILKKSIAKNNLIVTAIDTRVKEEGSLAGKLELKGAKYASLSDITDILGARIITFYSDEVDKVAAIVESLFQVDWANSVDKRKMHNLDSFGYNSLHYICQVPKALFSDPEHPELNDIKFEIQMRTTLQHAWATMYHDTGYKSGIEIPTEYLRNLNRLAGMLELADEQFSLIRTSITDYRRHVQSLVADGNFGDVSLNADSFRSYLKLGPFDKLTKKIAAINQAEIHKSSAVGYLEVLKGFGFETLKDVEDFVKENSEDAYDLAVFQIGNTDLDIISSTIAIQDLCIVHILKRGGGVDALRKLFNTIEGKSDYNTTRAERLLETAKQLSFYGK